MHQVTALFIFTALFNLTYIAMETLPINFFLRKSKPTSNGN